MNNNYNVFDIETEALPESEVGHLMPEFKAPSNYKDQAKIFAYQQEQKQEWLEKLALSPVTSRVLVIGVWMQSTGKIEILEGDEADILTRFWNLVGLGGIWVGFNSNGFDLPCIIKRSLKLGVKPAVPLFKSKYGKELDRFLDLQEYWQGGDKNQYTSLDTVCQFLLGRGKNGSGKDFAKNYRQDREKALAYAVNDIELTRDLGFKMGVIPVNEYIYVDDEKIALNSVVYFEHLESRMMGLVTKIGANSITITREGETYIKDLLDGTVTKI